MNGRVYDPDLGRFLSPDPYIQAPKNLQSYNRYAYVINNPLSYTDPSGYFFGKIRKKAKKAVKKVRRKVNSIGRGVVNTTIAINNIPIVRQVGTVVACSYGPQACGAYVGLSSYAETGSLKQGLIAGLSAAATSTIANSELSYGEKFALHAAVGVARSQTAGSSRGGGSSGVKVVGGTASELSGGKFANGARTAAFAYSFGEIARNVQSQTGERALRFSSKDELAAALGENGFTTGARPLKNLGEFMVEGQPSGALDVSNAEVLHEHVFYTRGGELFNIGFSPDGLRPDSNFPGNISSYRFAPIQRGVIVAPQILNPSGFAGEGYKFFTHNCQDYCSAVRRGLFK